MGENELYQIAFHFREAIVAAKTTHYPHPNTPLYLNNYKRKEVITYAQNERQQKPSQNQYHQRLHISGKRQILRLG